MHGDRRASNTTAILLGALLLSAAYLTGPCGSSGPPPPVPVKSVREQVLSQLQAQLQPRPPAAGEATLKRIVVTDVRFSRGGDRLLVEFDVTWDPPATTRGSAVLADDGFGRYRGEWNDGRFRVPLAVR